MDERYTPGTLKLETTAIKEIHDALEEALSMCDASWFAGDETTRTRIVAALALLNGDADLPARI